MPFEEKVPYGLMWFRSDLRIEDNKALYHAIKAHPHGLHAIFCICEDQWKEHDWGDAKVEFLRNHLQSLSEACLELNIGLHVVISKTFKHSIRDVIHYAKQHQIKDIYLNKEVEYNEQQRDLVFKEECKEQNISVYEYQDSCLISPGQVRSLQGTAYTVFTPFKKRWLLCLEELSLKCLKRPKPLPNRVSEPSPIPEEIKGFKKIKLSWECGEKVALKKLKRFLKDNVEYYHEKRDFPDLDGTSTLSPYLALGVISPRTCYLKSLSSMGPGAETWRSELIWREFYRHLMVDFPRLSKGRAFKLETENLDWSKSKQDFDLWCQGKTGIPLVDAAMRQLLETHWMHNRLRMVVAMFLTKNLRIHWSLGEKFFAQHLIDFDLAANNGGWQWSASTGCDAAPYFRIFNPVSQSKKFDPQAQFIKKYCHELSQLPEDQCHEPHAKGQNLFALDYPLPIVDLKATRLKAIDMFKKLK